MHRFDPSRAHRLDDPERLRFQNPADLLRILGARRGMVCVDIGAGTGFYTLPLAVAVGPERHVYAFDVSAAMLERLRVRLGGTRNVTPRVSDEARLPFGNASADLAPGQCFL